jgi:RNA polymerase sigma-70 factor (ECF subfamily)
VGLDTIAEPEDNTPSVEAQMIQSDRMTALDHALAQLPERQRQAVVLRHIEGLANPEIADVLEISVDAVESLTARARRNLAKILDGQQEALGYGTE